MGRRPQRPRTHELETASRRRFESLLPDAWVSRPISEDYGVDVEVEIFEGGEATGLTFRVQLKATDTAPKRGKISRSDIKVESLEYWRSLDCPVLVVLFANSTSTFYARWAHSYDQYPKKTDAKTITFRFGPEHIFTVDSCKHLATDVQFAKDWKRRNLPLPYPLTFPPGQTGMQGHSYQRLLAVLREAVQAVPGVVALADGRYAGRLILSDTAVTVMNPIELSSMTFHVPETVYRDPQGHRSIVADAMIAVGHILLAAGHPKAAGDLIRTFQSNSAVLEQPHNVEAIAELFVERSHAPEAFHLIEEWIDSESDEKRATAEFVLLSIFVHLGYRQLTTGDMENMVARLQSRFQLERRTHQPVKAGQTIYGIGEIYRARHDWPGAAKAFAEALNYDPTYGKRGYFWRALGSVHYEQGNMDAAIAAYESAVRCGDCPEASFLLADVLMNSGKYRAASDIALREAASDYYALGERFIRRTLAAIVEFTSLEVQARNSPPLNIVEALQRDNNSTAVISALKAYDALDHRLWQLLSDALLTEDGTKAQTACIVASDLKRTDATLWAVSACGAVALDLDEAVIDDICDAGLKWSGTEFLDAVEFACSEESGILTLQFRSESFRAKVRDKVYDRSEQDRPRWPRVVRLVDDAGTYITFGIEPH